VAEAVEFSLMNVVLWLLVLVGGASLGFAFHGAVSGLTLSSLGGAAFFPFAALLVRLVIWSLTR
jgi:hypothetical protein